MSQAEIAQHRKKPLVITPREITCPNGDKCTDWVFELSQVSSSKYVADHRLDASPQVLASTRLDQPKLTRLEMSCQQGNARTIEMNDQFQLLVGRDGVVFVYDFKKVKH